MATVSNLHAKSIVVMVNEDAELRESVERLLRSAGCEARTFGSAREFLSRTEVLAASCLVLDVALAEVDGLELQRRVAIERPDLPVVFVTGVRDVPTTVRALKAGAIDFLTTPCADDVLLQAIAFALERGQAALARRRSSDELLGRYASLSRREREVMALVVAGRLNKRVGAELGISEITVKAHRGSVMRKMTAQSLPDLVTMAARLEIAIPTSGKSAPAPRPASVIGLAAALGASRARTPPPLMAA